MRKRFEMLSYLLDDIRSLSPYATRLVIAGLFVFIVLLIYAWQFVVPLVLLVLGIAFYLRYSRPKDSL